MAKFIKFTNVQPKDLFGNNESAVEEIILSTDQICSIAKSNDKFVLRSKSVIIEMIEKGRYKTTPNAQSTLISKEDYENAKKILLRKHCSRMTIKHCLRTISKLSYKPTKKQDRIMDDKLIIPASRWIPVGEDTPKPGQLILTDGTITVFEDNKEVYKQDFDTPLMEKYNPEIGYCGNNTTDDGTSYTTVSQVTHWTPCHTLRKD